MRSTRMRSGIGASDAAATGACSPGSLPTLPSPRPSQIDASKHDASAIAGACTAPSTASLAASPITMRRRVASAASACTTASADAAALEGKQCQPLGNSRWHCYAASLTLSALCPDATAGSGTVGRCEQPGRAHASGIERTPGASTVLLRIAMHRPLQMPGKKKASVSGSPTCARSSATISSAYGHTKHPAGCP